METTFRKSVKGSTMETIFDKGTDKFNVKFFKCLNFESEEAWRPDNFYQYEITLRHNENTNARKLFNAEVKLIEQK